MKQIKIKKLGLRADTVRTLSTGDLGRAAGGNNSNLTCQAGCGSIGCHTHHVSEVAHCTIHTL